MVCYNGRLILQAGTEQWMLFLQLFAHIDYPQTVYGFNGYSTVNYNSTTQPAPARFYGGWGLCSQAGFIKLVSPSIITPSAGTTSPGFRWYFIALTAPSTSMDFCMDVGRAFFWLHYQTGH